MHYVVIVQLVFYICDLHCQSFPILSANNDDVLTGTFFVYVPAHQNEVYAKIQIYDDSIFEGTEEFGVQLYIPDHHKENGVQLGDPSHAVVFIKDGKMAVHFYFEKYICTTR